MAQPFITLSNIAPYSGTLDLTALTGGVAELGYTGADWNNRGGAYFREKLQGSGQLRELEFGGTLSYFLYAWSGQAVRYDASDSSSNATSTETESRAYYPPTSSDVGLGVYCTPNADQKRRKIRWYCRTSGGPWTVTATLSDGSVAPASLVLSGTDTDNSFMCTYTGKVAESTLDLRVTKTGVPGGYFASGVRYSEIPVNPARPRNFSL